MASNSPSHARFAFLALRSHDRRGYLAGETRPRSATLASTTILHGGRWALLSVALHLLAIDFQAGFSPFLSHLDPGTDLSSCLDRQLDPFKNAVSRVFAPGPYSSVGIELDD